MAYGGLRGGVGFSLVKMVDKKVIPAADMFVTTALMVVMATIWIQGSTIKPLVNLLDVDKAQDEQRNLLEELTDTVLDSVMPGIENILGKTGRHHIRAVWAEFDDKYMMRWFTRCETSLGPLVHKTNRIEGLQLYLSFHLSCSCEACFSAGATTPAR